ncbi:hypothetical protein D3C72_512730 [compost metagenome]
MGRHRPGLTLVELLIAAALGTGILALGLQQMTEYFRLQQVLITRTQLSQNSRVAMDAIAKHMRYTTQFGPTGDGHLGVVPLDDNHDAIISASDRYRLLLWRVVEDPLQPGNRILQEKSVEVPAFHPVEEVARMLPFFEAKMGTGRRLASHVQSFEVTRKRAQLSEVKLEVTQTVSRQKEPVVLTFSEMVACRNIQIADAALPKLEAVLKQLKEKP